MFKMLKDCINDRGLELSAQYFISDVETNIRKSFSKYFKGIELRECHLHYAKGFWSKMVNNAFKVEYSSRPSWRIVRACSVLPYVPPDRLNEGVQNL